MTARLLKRIKAQFTWRRLRYRWRQLRNRFVENKVLWSEGIAEEIQFWRELANNKDVPEYEYFVSRANPEAEFIEELKDILDCPDGSRLDILVLGSGPITRIGYKWGNRDIHITPIDPLADAYNQILAEADIHPPFPSIAMPAEEIAQHFEANSFSAVVSFNALDHAYDPMSAIRQGMDLLKPEGKMYLYHKRNEGKRVYGGLHQWNFDLQNGEFVIWNMKTRYQVRDEIQAKSLEVSLKDTAIGEHIIVIITK